MCGHALRSGVMTHTGSDRCCAGKHGPDLTKKISNNLRAGYYRYYNPYPLLINAPPLPPNKKNKIWERSLFIRGVFQSGAVCCNYVV